MAIRLQPPATDAQGLPVVTWTEDRNVFAPGGVSPARVSCFIRPDDNGILQFVKVGLVRHGKFDEARPWETLTGFEVSSADKLYPSASERALLDMLGNKSKSGVGRVLMTDGAIVILANFGDEQRSVAMHLNCASCTPVEAARLHDRLRLEFLDRRHELVSDRCKGDYAWPMDLPFESHKPVVAASLPWWLRRLGDVFVLIILGLVGAAFYLLLAR
jgi:hypothetical protein